MTFQKKPRFVIVFLKEFRETLRDKRSGRVARSICWFSM